MVDYGSIECNQRITGSIAVGQTITFSFTNPDEQDVTFTTCYSTFDTVLHLVDSTGTAIHEQGLTDDPDGCNGDDCYIDAVCSKSQFYYKTTFMMASLSADSYSIELSAYYHVEGDFVLDIYCMSHAEAIAGIAVMTISHGLECVDSNQVGHYANYIECATAALRQSNCTSDELGVSLSDDGSYDCKCCAAGTLYQADDSVELIHYENSVLEDITPKGI